MKLQVMTYNIASGRCYKNDCDITQEGSAPVDLSQCADVIRRVDPDLCGLNEINVYLQSYLDTNRLTKTATDQPRYLADATGLPYRFFGEATSWDGRGAYGNAVISKYPVLDAESVPIPNPKFYDEPGKYYEPRGIAKVKLDIAGGITILQVQVGLAVSESQNAVVTLCKLIDEAQGPVILMGDFNMCPDNFLLDRIRQRLTEVTPKGEGYVHSFPSWTHESDVPPAQKICPYCKIDYIFVSKHFTPVTCEVLKERASDHMPMVATLEFDPEVSK